MSEHTAGASRTRVPLGTADPDPAPVPALELAMLKTAASRLVDRWRTLATRIEPYGSPAARAYEQAADDLEGELAKHPGRMDALVALRDEIVAAVQKG